MYCEYVLDFLHHIDRVQKDALKDNFSRDPAPWWVDTKPQSLKIHAMTWVVSTLGSPKTASSTEVSIRVPFSL